MVKAKPYTLLILAQHGVKLPEEARAVARMGVTLPTLTFLTGSEHAANLDTAHLMRVSEVRRALNIIQLVASGVELFDCPRHAARTFSQNCWAW